jgi:DNA-binding response OmpR family regulator
VQDAVKLAEPSAGFDEIAMWSYQADGFARVRQTLIRHVGKVITQRRLLVEVWGAQHSEQSQYLRVYMAQLRRKLEADPARPTFLLTEPGVGYRLVEML